MLENVGDSLAVLAISWQKAMLHLVSIKQITVGIVISSEESPPSKDRRAWQGNLMESLLPVLKPEHLHGALDSGNQCLQFMQNNERKKATSEWLIWGSARPAIAQGCVLPLPCLRLSSLFGLIHQRGGAHYPRSFTDS